MKARRNQPGSYYPSYHNAENKNKKNGAALQFVRGAMQLRTIDRIEWISYEGLLPIHVDGSSTSIQLIRKYCLYNEDEQGTLISNTIDGDSTAIRLLHTES